MTPSLRAETVSIETFPGNSRDTFPRVDAPSSGVSWAAVVAGAFVIASASLALLALGAGIGFSSVSPWAHDGASGAAIGWSAIAWLVLMQVVTCSLGGYLAGRLRTRWNAVHSHEVYFRDTAHGLLSWAVGLVITAAFLTSAATTMVGGAAAAGVGAAAGQAANSGDNDDAYVIDTMFRTSTPATVPENGNSQGREVERIFANSLKTGALPASDRTYLAQLVAARTGLSQAEAEQRVNTADTQARQAADTARKAVAHSLYWTFLALLVGAFTASYAATIGGQLRDRVPVA